MKRTIRYLCVMLALSMFLTVFAVAEAEKYALENVDPFGLLKNGSCFGLDINDVLGNLEENTDYEKIEYDDGNMYFVNDYFNYMDFTEDSTFFSFSTLPDSNLIDGITYHYVSPPDTPKLLSGSVKSMIEEIEQVYGVPLILYYPLTSPEDYRSYTKTTLTICLNNRTEGNYVVMWETNDFTISLAVYIDPSLTYDYGHVTFTSNSENINNHAEPTPMDVNNGDIIVATDYECLCPLTIETSDDKNYYVFLDYVSSPYNSTVERKLANKYGSADKDSISFYVEAGKTVEIDVPIGVYKLYYATGDVFYNAQTKFGEDTRSYSSDELLTFYADENYYNGHILTLYPVANGDFETDPIPPEEFPIQ